MRIPPVFRKCFATLAMLLASLGQAQVIDAPALVLDPAEIQKLRAIADQEVDPNQLNSSKVEQFKQKELAAVKLGDMVAREKNLREWMKFDEDGAWILRGYLATTERRAEAYELGHQIIRKTAWPPSKARMSVFVAENYIEDGDLIKANELLTSAETTLRTSSRSARDGAGIYIIGDTDVLYHTVRAKQLARMGKLADAITSAQLAAQKSREQIKIEGITNERHRFMGRNTHLRALYQLAILQTSAGLYTDAESSLREAYQSLRKFGYSDALMAPFYFTVADLYNANGDFKEALAFSQRGEKIITTNGFLPGSIAWLAAQSRAYTALVGMDQWEKALQGFDAADRAVAESRLETGMGKRSELRGMVYVRNGQYDKAEALLEEARSWYETHLGPEHHQTAMVEGLLACALVGQSKQAQARPLFEHAVANLSAPETLTGDMTDTAMTRKMKRFVLQGYARLLADSARTDTRDAEQLFKIADQFNTSSVQQALSEAAVRSGVKIPGLSDIIRQEQDAKNEITVLSGYIRSQETADGRQQTPQAVEQMRVRLAELEKQRKVFKAQIQKSYPEYFQLIQPRAASPLEIAKLLQPDELFVAIIPMDEQVLAWAIQANGKIHFHRAEMRQFDLEQTVNRIRQTLDVAELGAKAPPFNHADAHGLYRRLFAPFDAEINASKHLIVSTSGSLAKLPFAVLPRTAATGSDWRQMSWLIKDVAISHVPSASGWMSLKKLSQQPTAREPLLAWGDPAFDPAATEVAMNATGLVRKVAVTRTMGEQARNVMDGASFLSYSKIPPLPETRQEVMELASIMHADPQRDLILGRHATRASVLEQSQSGHLASKQVVVFATHGLLAGDLPHLNQPALAMAATKNPQESPLLTLEDVLGLKLNADWVVLSACNTAGADGKAEEAMSGLARGFFYAGSRSLLVTHWSVESESAMLLTTRTFSAYQKDPAMRRADALRQAMLQTMQMPRYAHPTYWSPYALVGEGGR
ncbi:MAG: CHAT domain-containing protein [Limnohabitans sp.]